jgi:hypothetical protein
MTMNAEARIDWESWEVDEPSAAFADAVMDTVRATPGTSVVRAGARRRTLARGRFIGALTAGAAALGALTVLAMMGRQVGRPSPAPAPSVSMAAEGRSSATANAGVAADRGSPSASRPPGQPRHAAGTAFDRQRRDEMQNRIMPASARRDVERDPHTGLVVPAGSNGPSHNLSREYLEQRIREDFYPMGLGCYVGALARKPDLRGQVVVDFMIVGDAKVGGIVDQAEINARSDIDDEEMRTCIRESMLSMVFAPPDGNGWVTVTYPFVFSPDDDDSVEQPPANPR